MYITKGIKNLKKYISKNNSLIILQTIVFVIFTVCMYWKCRYGFANIDESFYITIPNRIIQGDHLFKDEWNLSLLSSYLVYPFVKLKLLFSGNLEGVCLYMRYMFVVVNTATAAFIWIRFKRYSEVGAWLSAIVFLIYTPFCISALSYNSGGIICFTISLILYMQKENIFEMVIAGFVFALGVFCCPYTAIIFVYLLIVDIYNKKSIKEIVAFVVGGLLLLGLFAFNILANMSVNEFLDILKMLASGDVDHNLSMISKILIYPQTVLFANVFNIYFIAAYAIIFVIMFFVRGQKKEIVFLITYVVTIINIITSLFVEHYINKLVFPVAIVGVIFYFHYLRGKQNELFQYMYIPGLIFTLTMHIQSNQFYYAIASGSLLMVLASMVFIYEVSKNLSLKKFSKAGCYLLFTVFILSELYLRIYNVFWEESILTQTTKLEKGPQKGLIVSDEKYDMYNEYYEEVTSNIRDDESVLFISDRTYLYLMGGFQNASYSAWLTGETNMWLPKLEEYYDFNPKKKPTVIFLDKEFLELEEAVDAMGYTDKTVTKKGNIVYR